MKLQLTDGAKKCNILKESSEQKLKLKYWRGNKQQKNYFQRKMLWLVLGFQSLFCHHDAGGDGDCGGGVLLLHVLQQGDTLLRVPLLHDNSRAGHPGRWMGVLFLLILLQLQ